MEDPRDGGEDVVLTDSSDEELADLEKEYAAKRQKLMEKKKQKEHQTKNNAVTVERKPLKLAGTRTFNPKETRGVDEPSQKLRPKIEDSKKSTFYRESPSQRTSSEKSAARTAANGAGKQHSVGNGRVVAAGSAGTTGISSGSSSSKNSSAFALSLEKSTAPEKINLATRQFEFVDIPAAQLLDVDEKDDLSGMRLRKRYIEADALGGLLRDTKALRVEKLLAKVNPPGYSEPPYANWCFVGVVLERLEVKRGKKGEVEQRKGNHNNDGAGEFNEKSNSETKDRPTSGAKDGHSSGRAPAYIKMLVGSFAHSVRVMLFGAAAERWWKIRAGDVVCILNPTVNRWAHQKKTGFNLVLNTAVDAILEVGLCRDFGRCKFENGCNTVIDTSLGTLCGFHQDLHFRKYASKRMELNGSVLARRPDDRKSSYVPYSQTNEQTTTYAAAPGIDRNHYTDPQTVVRAQKAARIAALARNGSLRRNMHTHGKAVQPFTSATLKEIGYDPVPRRPPGLARDVQLLLRDITALVKSRLLKRQPQPKAVAEKDYSSDSSLEIEEELHSA